MYIQRKGTIFSIGYLLNISLIFLFLPDSCHRQSSYERAGVIKYGLKKYDSVSHNYILDSTFWPANKIWYKDSMAIEEIKGLSMEDSEDGKLNIHEIIKNYTFIDIRTRSFYEFTSFADTARLIKKYIQPDSVKTPGAWTFYVPAVKYEGYEPFQPLPDTLINRIVYNRKRVFYTNKLLPEKKRWEYILYFRCDKKGSVFNLFKDPEGKIDCPCVRIDNLPVSVSPLSISQQIEYISDHLTPQELKIFKAWEKIAKENPVE